MSDDFTDPDAPIMQLFANAVLSDGPPLTADDLLRAVRHAESLYPRPSEIPDPLKRIVAQGFAYLSVKTYTTLREAFDRGPGATWSVTEPPIPMWGSIKLHIDPLIPDGYLSAVPGG